MSPSQRAQEHELLSPISEAPAPWHSASLENVLASSGSKLKEQLISIPELYVRAELLMSQVRAGFLCTCLKHVNRAVCHPITALPTGVDSYLFSCKHPTQEGQMIVQHSTQLCLGVRGGGD